MKKSIITVALMAMVSITASAVSIDWGTTAFSFEGRTLKNANVSTYLIYLSEGPQIQYDVGSLLSSVADGTGTSDADGTSSFGKAIATFVFDYGTYKNGDQFVLLASYQAGGKTWYNLSSNVNTISGLDDTISTPTFTNFSFSKDKAAEGSPLTAGGGWTVVPEPATGMLALAGVALLFRRKRA